jgi:hypothetical protein
LQPEILAGLFYANAKQGWRRRSVLQRKRENRPLLGLCGTFLAPARQTLLEI